jgi:hypothetical protein
MDQPLAKISASLVELKMVLTVDMMLARVHVCDHAGERTRLAVLGAPPWSSTGWHVLALV